MSSIVKIESKQGTLEMTLEKRDSQSRTKISAVL